MSEKKNAPELSDKDMENITKSSIQLLNEQDKVKVKLWLSQEDRKKLENSQEAGKKVEWPFETVQINGHTYQIQRGVEVEVPQSVKEILEQAGLI